MRLFVSHDTIEQELVGRVRQGDGSALRVVFERHAPALHRLAFHLLGSRDDADDVVQDVFVGLRASLTRYTESGSFEAWLRRLTTRASLMRLRAESRRAVAHSASDPAAELPSPDPILGDHLSRSIAALPPTLRAVVVLRMIEEYSHEEIATALGLSLSASKVRLHRALRLLRPQLEHLRKDR